VESGEKWKEVDHARPYTAKVTRAFCDDNFVRIAPYPLYSLAFAPSDFSLSLVWASQNGLQGQQFGSAEEFLSEIRKILDEISVDLLEAVFREWINRLARCIAALQQMERTWNRVDNDPLIYSWKGSDLEMPNRAEIIWAWSSGLA
jgi:hypothetical protein